MENRKERKINAARICFSISRIGYTPASAICDIIDNAVSAHASNIHVEIIPKQNDNNINKKNNIDEYRIIDDGDGMNQEKLENALDLGSDDSLYTKDTLSKFGLGLKSASFAQGNKLEVISGDGNSIHKEYVDLEEIEDKYFSVEDDVDDIDRELIDKYFVQGKKGTIIRIKKIHEDSHPSMKDTMKELKEKVGVIYYYFLERNLHIYINNEEIKPFDPLFVEEAANNNLDENEWDGKSVQWILKPKEILLDSENKIKGKIEITMLPHPKVRKNEGISDAEIRQKYHINANNYGFYVYRNKRLINWANKLDIIPYDQNYYAFRGRINIDADADNAFNIDVSKSHINLSEEAKDSLNDYIAVFKTKCRNAWENAYNKYKAMLSEDSTAISNGIVNNIKDNLETSIDFEDKINYDEVEKREQELIEQSRQKGIKETIDRIKDEININKKEDEITEEEINTTIKGNNNVSELNNIFKVQTIMDNILWEPYMDAEKSECVRISKNHRYSKLIYENNEENKDLQVLYELFLYILTKAEFKIRKKYQGVSSDELAKIFQEYRIIISENLARLCRNEEDNLPPNLN